MSVPERVARLSLGLALAFAVWALALGGCAAKPASAQAAPTGMPPPGIPREAVKYRPTVIREVRYYWGLAEPPSTFMAQIFQESRFKAEARSAYASGLSQFTPDTAAWIQGLYPADLKVLCDSRAGCPGEPGWAIRALVLYDRRLHAANTFAANGDERWGFTLMGYNAGGGWVTRERRACAARPPCDQDRWFAAVETTCLRAPQNCAQTQDYVRLILLSWRPKFAAWLGT